MLQQMEVTVGFVSQPKVIRDGQAAMCVVRPPSAKELAKKQKNKAVEPKSEDQTPGNTATDNNRDLTEEPRTQQWSDGNKTFSHKWADVTVIGYSSQTGWVDYRTQHQKTKQSGGLKDLGPEVTQVHKHTKQL